MSSAGLQACLLWRRPLGLPAPQITKFFQAVGFRTSKSILAKRGYEARANRVLEDVTRDGFSRFVAAKNMLVITRLPQSPLLGTPTVLESRHLFEAFDERTEVRCVTRRFNQCVKMVRHYAVREDCEVEVSCVLEELLTDSICERRICKRASAKRNAGCQKVSLEANVRSAVESTWSI